MPRIRKYLIAIYNSVEEASVCISCKRERVAICPFCFTEFVFNQLKKFEVNRLILIEFVRFFNFNFENINYSKKGKNHEEI